MRGRAQSHRGCMFNGLQPIVFRSHLTLSSLPESNCDVTATAHHATHLTFTSRESQLPRDKQGRDNHAHHRGNLRLSAGTWPAQGLSWLHLSRARPTYSSSDVAVGMCRLAGSSAAAEPDAAPLLTSRDSVPVIPTRDPERLPVLTYFRL